MNKWNINNLEKRTLKTLKRNCLSLGVDIAYTGDSGWVILYTDDKYLHMVDKGLFNTKKQKVITDKLDKINDETQKIATKFFQEESLLDAAEKNYKTIACIEHPFVGRNPRGALVLGMAAGIAYLNVKQVCKLAYFQTAMQARKKVGIYPANCKKEKVMEWVERFFDLKEDNNIGDGFVLALGGLIISK